MAKTKFEEMYHRLPSNVKESDVLRLESKKVLAALLELLLHSEARNTRVIFANNRLLRKLSGISSNQLLPSLQQLEDYELISRKVGGVRSKPNEKGLASEYVINLEKLKEPIVEKGFDELFGESLEKPINTTITTTITTTTSTTNTTTTANTITSTNTSSSSKDKYNYYSRLIGKKVLEYDCECDSNFEVLDRLLLLEEELRVECGEELYMELVHPMIERERERLI